MLVDRLTNARRLQEMIVIAECFRMDNSVKNFICETFFLLFIHYLSFRFLGGPFLFPVCVLHASCEKYAPWCGSKRRAPTMSSMSRPCAWDQTEVVLKASVEPRD